MRGSELLPAIRLYRQGYPDYLPLGEFVRRFNVLVPPDALPTSLLTGLNNSTSNEKQAAEILLLHIDLERSSYRLGLSQVSCRFFVLSVPDDFAVTDIYRCRTSTEADVLLGGSRCFLFLFFSFFFLLDDICGNGVPARHVLTICRACQVYNGEILKSISIAAAANVKSTPIHRICASSSSFDSKWPLFSRFPFVNGRGAGCL